MFKGHTKATNDTGLKKGDLKAEVDVSDKKYINHTMDNCATLKYKQQ